MHAHTHRHTHTESQTCPYTALHFTGGTWGPSEGKRLAQGHTADQGQSWEQTSPLVPRPRRKRTNDVLNRTSLRKTQKVPFKTERRCQAQPHSLQGLTCSCPSTPPLGPGPPAAASLLGPPCQTVPVLSGEPEGANVFGKLSLRPNNSWAIFLTPQSCRSSSRNHSYCPTFTVFGRIK